METGWCPDIWLKSWLFLSSFGGSAPPLREESSQRQPPQASQNHAELKEKMMKLSTSQDEASHREVSFLLMSPACVRRLCVSLVFSGLTNNKAF